MEVFALSVHKEGQPDVTVQIKKKIAALLVVFIHERGFPHSARQRRDQCTVISVSTPSHTSFAVKPLRTLGIWN